MATKIIPQILASFLILFLTTPTAIAQHNHDHDHDHGTPPAPVVPVVVNDIFDTDAERVVLGRKYYILPVVQRRGGGITTAPKTTDNECPLYVAQETHTTALGIPVKFFPPSSASQNITFSMDMNIIFTSTNNCNQSPVWTLKLDEATGTRFVAPGGVAAYPGRNTINNWFRIERFFPRFHFDYKLVYCPSVCQKAEVSCGDLGIYIQEDGTWRLGVGAPPLRIKFKKA